MKFKAILGIALALVLAASLLLWNRHRVPRPNQSAKVPIQPSIAIPASTPPPAFQPAPVPNALRMTVVKGKSEAATFNLPDSNWSAVQLIVDSRIGFPERINAIKSLSPQLTEEDWNLLSRFLTKPDSLDQDQAGQVLKNYLMDALCTLSPPPTGLGDVLISIFRDREQNGVLRDYAVQHMAAYYEQLRSQNNTSQEEQKIRDALWEAANETGTSIGGTALLSLQHLSGEYSGDFDKGKIASTALQMAKQFGGGELTHITAYQVCAQLGVTEALPIVLEAAQNGQSTPIRISAVAALGLLGGADQIPLLNTLLAGTEDRLKPAARHALNQIMARNHQPAN